MDSNSEKLIIYQVFPRILTNTTEHPEPWGTLERNGAGHLADYTPRVLKSIRELGVNALWLTGLVEHATLTPFPEIGVEADHPDVVKGVAGSPYAIRDYYDVSPAIAADKQGRMREFEELLARAHAEGLKVIIDFVPNHTARHYHSDAAPCGTPDFGAADNRNVHFSPSNNYYYLPGENFVAPKPSGAIPPYEESPAKATGNDAFTAHPSEYDWYETAKLNFGREYLAWGDHFEPTPDTWLKLTDILLFWASKGVDGFRCDMVFMVPLPFWHYAIERVKERYPSTIFIGEIYDISQYRDFLNYGRFDYLYDKVGLYDTLVAIDTLGWGAGSITGCWQAVDGIGSRMVNFLENHDEVRYASDAYAHDGASVLPPLVVSSMLSTGPFLLYYGQELGERGEENEGFAGNNHRTTIFDYWSYDKMRRWYDHGRVDGRRLSGDERQLRALYGRVLRLCNSSPAIRCGGFFDLMYVNLHNGDFDARSCFAFLRHAPEEALLIVANFAYDSRRCGIIIPAAAFEAAGLEPGTAEGMDLLSGKPLTLTLEPDAPAHVEVAGRGAVVWQYKKNATKLCAPERKLRK